MIKINQNSITAFLLAIMLNKPSDDDLSRNRNALMPQDGMLVRSDLLASKTAIIFVFEDMLAYNRLRVSVTATYRIEQYDDFAMKLVHEETTIEAIK